MLLRQMCRQCAKQRRLDSLIANSIAHHQIPSPDRQIKIAKSPNHQITKFQLCSITAIGSSKWNIAPPLALRR
jgi:hypothetical protein